MMGRVTPVTCKFQLIAAAGDKKMSSVKCYTLAASTLSRTAAGDDL